jgi:aspartate kinase
MSRIVCKFGGTSVADAAQIRKVRSIIQQDPRRSVIVPSAPGKRIKAEAKITDLLYLCYKTASVQANFGEPFQEIRQRYLEIAHELGLRTDLQEQFDSLGEQLRQGCTRDYVASRGEYYNGLLLAEYLGADLVDPRDFVVILPNGRVDPTSYDLLGQRLADPGRTYVMPGFYGRDRQGQVKTFSRGGSDISGAIAARAANAELYENWTDVSGLLMADPKVVDNPRPMQEVTYREIRELSYMGANVFHDEAILPVIEVGIPICIKNTNEPQHPGTRIVARRTVSPGKGTEIAGIAGKPGFSMICVEKSLMNKELGFAYHLLGVMQSRGINVEHCPSSIDGINVIVECKYLQENGDVVLDEIRRVLQPDSVTLEPELALIAVVGEGMSHSIGIAAKVFAALRDANVNVRVINQGASELNIIIGVVPDDFARATRAIYGAFVPAS